MKATSDFDDDLPNTGKFPQSIQRLVRFFKLEYLRNRRMQLMLLGKSREFNHHIATAAAQSSLNYCNQKVSQMHSKKKKKTTENEVRLTTLPPKKQRLRQSHRLVLFVQHSQQSYTTAIPQAVHGVQEVRSTHDIDHDINSDAVGQFERFRGPIWGVAVVDRVRRAELAGGFEFGVRGRGCYYCGAGCGGDLGSVSDQKFDRTRTIVSVSH
jgi:hypothetical protein